MSKSLGNYVGVTDPPKDMFGKVMSISDELMFRYYELLTDLSLAEIDALRKKMNEGAVHPKRVKMDLARRIVTDFHSQALAEEAEAEFESVFKKGNLPEDMPEHRLSPGTYRLSHLMVDTGTAKSRGEASRLIKQGAVELGGERFKADTEMSLSQPGDVVLKVGKSRFVRLVVEG